jgi:hypothetical protein
MPRHRDHNDVVGNLEPGQTLLGEPIAEVIEGRSYTYEGELARQRVENFWPRRDPPPRAPRPAFNHRSLRRG